MKGNFYLLLYYGSTKLPFISFALHLHTWYSGPQEGLKIQGCKYYLVGIICLRTLVEIGLTDLPKSPPAPPGTTPLPVLHQTLNTEHVFVHLKKSMKYNFGIKNFEMKDISCNCLILIEGFNFFFTRNIMFRNFQTCSFGQLQD